MIAAQILLAVMLRCIQEIIRFGRDDMFSIWRLPTITALSLDVKIKDKIILIFLNIVNDAKLT